MLETSAITLDNRGIASLLDSRSFSLALQGVREGWIFSTQETNQFPHINGDSMTLPDWLEDLVGTPAGGPTHGGVQRHSRGSAALEGWCLHISSVQMKFQESGTETDIESCCVVKKFPIHAWVFPPHSHPAPTPSTQPQPTTTQPVVFIAHTPKPVWAELEQLQLLILMRLKDSLLLYRDSFLRALSRELSAGQPDERSLNSSREQVPGGHHSEGARISNSCSTQSRNTTMPADGVGRPSQDSVSHNSPIPEAHATNATHIAKVIGCMVIRSVGLDLLVPSADTSPSDTSSTLEDYTPDEQQPIEGNLSRLLKDNTNASELSWSECHHDLSDSTPTSYYDNEDSVLFASLGASLPFTNTVSTPTVFQQLNAEHLYAHEGNRAFSEPDIHGLEKEAWLSLSSSRTLAFIPEDNRTSTPNAKFAAGRTDSSPDTTAQSDLGTSPSPRPLSTVFRNDTQTNNTHQSSYSPTNKLTTPHSTRHRVLQIRADQFCALSSIQGSDISVKVSIDTAHVDDVDPNDLSSSQGQNSVRPSPQEEGRVVQRQPVISGRLEVGEQTRRFLTSLPDIDGVLMVKTDGLQASLLLPTMKALTESLKDKFEGGNEVQLPTQLLIENTKILVKEATQLTTEAPNSLSIQIRSAQVSRGREVEAMDLFSVGGGREWDVQTEADQPNGEARRAFTVTLSSLSSLTTHTTLVEPLHSYSRNLEADEAGRLHGPQPPEDTPPLNSFSSQEGLSRLTPPSYSEAISLSISPPTNFTPRMPTNHTPIPAISSSAHTIHKLHEENQQLREDNRQMLRELLRTREELESVIHECTAIREELETHRQPNHKTT